MEKKGNRSLLSQPSPKGLNADSKKNQDVSSSKPWPSRGSRPRRETTSNIIVKSDPVRSPRNGKFDKRPRPRGSCNSTTGTGSSATTGDPCPDTGELLLGDEAAGLARPLDAEFGSVFLPGSKKQSLNHLLNFHYAPREGHGSAGEREPTRKGRDKSNMGIATCKHRYNKENFLQANCQFIVNENGDYRKYLNNPDALVDWNLIEQVNVQVSDFPFCPICLYPPMAAKMTRCGHIYCWSCVLHYLSLTDKTWQKCPICFEPICSRDLRSVVAIPHSTFNRNETITFKLMRRAKGSLIAYPVDVQMRDENYLFHMSERDHESVYSKLLIANINDVLAIINRERGELLTRRGDSEMDSEWCFIELAMEELVKREENVLQNFDNWKKGNLETSAIEEELPNSELNDSQTDVDESNLLHTGVKGIKFYYFYQASDGQHIYLHPVNAKMLEHTYGSLEHAPISISGKILEKEGGSMTEDIRRRLRYLSHMPVTCQFEFAEIHIKAPLVSKETIEDFQGQLDARRRARQRRQKDERRREKRIELEENRKIGHYPAVNIHLESQDQFPDFEPTPRIRSDSENNNDRSGLSSSSTSSSVEAGTETESMLQSFASMCATKKERSSKNVPSRQSQPVAPPVKYITATGVNMTAGRRFQRREGSDPELEDVLEFVPQPMQHSMGDIIAEALSRKSAIQEMSVDDGATSSKGKKKKKKNKIVIKLS